MSRYVPATDALLAGWCGPVQAWGQNAVVLGPGDRPEDLREGPWLVMACTGEWDGLAGTDYGYMVMSCATADIRLDTENAQVKALLGMDRQVVALKKMLRDLGACPYNEGMAPCRLGFPGCACADDMALDGLDG